MKILLLSPYHGGSHRAWAEGYKRFSRHEVSLLVLPARFWKWRMHGGSVTLARNYLRHFERSQQSLVGQRNRPDLILATDMVDLTTFLALTRNITSQSKVAIYMHENQLTYPLPQEANSGPMRRQKGERDLHYAFVNYASMMAADLVLFNSSYHMGALFDELPRYLKHFPEFNELDTIPLLKYKSRVLPVGIDLRRLSTDQATDLKGKGPIIIWNQRWEYDKNPKLFFKTLHKIAEEGLAFQVVLCGQNFRQQPHEFTEAMISLSEHIIYSGYANEREYARLLQEAAITISTARHEFFGISFVEAIFCKTFPILPNRLSYPEVIPEQFHGLCLYGSESGLLSRLRWSLENPIEVDAMASDLAQLMEIYDWRNIVDEYDDLFESQS